MSAKRELAPPGSLADVFLEFRTYLTDIRYRRDGKLEYGHTLNGTGATARALLSVLENFQDENGTVAVPEILQRYGAPATLGTKPAS